MSRDSSGHRVALSIMLAQPSFALIEQCPSDWGPPGRGVGAPWVLPQGLTRGPPPGGPERTSPGVRLLVYTHTRPVSVGFMSRSATLGASHTYKS